MRGPGAFRGTRAEPDAPTRPDGGPPTTSITLPPATPNPQRPAASLRSRRRSTVLRKEATQEQGGRLPFPLVQGGDRLADPDTQQLLTDPARGGLQDEQHLTTVVQVALPTHQPDPVRSTWAGSVSPSPTARPLPGPEGDRVDHAPTPPRPREQVGQRLLPPLPASEQPMSPSRLGAGQELAVTVPVGPRGDPDARTARPTPSRSGAAGPP